MSNFEHLSNSIRNLNDNLRSAVVHSANKALTIRNWLIGWYIVEYEQHGEDRTGYGTGLLDKLSVTLQANSVKGVSVLALRSLRQFYTVYNKLRSAILPIYKAFVSQPSQIQQKPSAEFASPLTSPPCPSPELLLNHFSFSHFVELMRITDTGKQLLDYKLFVSKYLTQLPSTDTLQDFLTGERERTILKLQEERAEYGRNS